MNDSLPTIVSDILSQLYALVGVRIVLLPLPFGKKRPDFDDWQKTTLVQSHSSEYQARIAQAIQRGGNLGVLLGPPSAGLVTIDIDRDELVDPFPELNPQLAATLRTRGARGVQLWMRMKTGSPYPNEQAVYKLMCDGEAVAELRCGGRPTRRTVGYLGPASRRGLLQAPGPGACDRVEL
jgi:hypothetical protein